MSLSIHPLLAAGGPVIPNFGGASKCVVQNHQFCMSWFLDNWNSVFGPRLVQHIVLTAIAVGVGMPIAFAAAIIAYKQSWFETPFALFAAFLYGIPAILVRAARSGNRNQSDHRGDRVGFLHAADPVP